MAHSMESFSNLPVMVLGECAALIEDLIANFSANPNNDLFDEDPQRLVPWLGRAVERMPIFERAGIKQIGCLVPVTKCIWPITAHCTGSMA